MKTYCKNKKRLIKKYYKKTIGFIPVLAVRIQWFNAVDYSFKQTTFRSGLFGAKKSRPFTLNLSTYTEQQVIRYARTILLLETAKTMSIFDTYLKLGLSRRRKLEIYKLLCS